MKTNTEYKSEALAALKGNWPQAVLATFIVGAVCILVWTPYYWQYAKLLENATDIEALSGSTVWWLIGFAAMMLVGGPLIVGMVNAFKNLLVRGENRLVDAEFKIAFGNWLHHFWGYFLKYFFVLLWSLLFLIPGIIKSLAYAMTNYILVDYPELSANKAIDLSQEMMKGHKYDLFYLYLSFIGWYFLSILTLGIGYLWLMPYIQSAQSSFYLDVKAEWEARRAS